MCTLTKKMWQTGASHWIVEKHVVLVGWVLVEKTLSFPVCVSKCVKNFELMTCPIPRSNDIASWSMLSDSDIPHVTPSGKSHPPGVGDHGQNWLVVTGCHEFGIFPEILGITHHPNGRSPSFFRGVETTNHQPEKEWECYFLGRCRAQQKTSTLGFSFGASMYTRCVMKKIFIHKRWNRSESNSSDVPMPLFAPGFHVFP